MIRNATITVQTINEDAPSFTRRRFIGGLKGETFREKLLSLLESHDSRYGNKDKVVTFTVSATGNNLKGCHKILITGCELVNPKCKHRLVIGEARAYIALRVNSPR